MSLSGDIRRSLQLKWGICSAGKICHDFVTAVKTLPAADHQIVAVVARNGDRAKEFATKHGIAASYGSYEEMAQDSNIDVVYIGTIHPEHCRLSKLFLNSGKHVLCEKPVALNLKETEEILQCAKQNQKFFMEGFWTVFFPAYSQIRQDLNHKTCGDIQVVVIAAGNDAGSLPRITQRHLGGGSLLNYGCYITMLATHLLHGDKPQQVIASGYLSEEGVDETVSITLMYSNNRMAQLLTSCSVKLHNKAFILGTEGQIHLPENFWCPSKLITPGKTYEYEIPDANGDYNFLNSGGLVYEANAVRDCIQKGELECSLMTHEDSRTNMYILDEVRRQLGVVYDADNK